MYQTSERYAPLWAERKVTLQLKSNDELARVLLGVLEELIDVLNICTYCNISGAYNRDIII